MSLEEQRTRDELKHKLLDLNQLHEQLAELRTICPSLLKLLHPETGTSRKFEKSAQEAIEKVNSFYTHLKSSQNVFDYAEKSLQADSSNLLPTYLYKTEDLSNDTENNETKSINGKSALDLKEPHHSELHDNDNFQNSDINIESFKGDIEASGSILTTHENKSFTLKLANELEFIFFHDTRGKFSVYCSSSKDDAITFSINRNNNFLGNLWSLLVCVFEVVRQNLC